MKIIKSKVMVKQNPFSVYDFLGYLILGSLMIYAYLTVDYFNNPNTHTQNIWKIP